MPYSGRRAVLPNRSKGRSDGHCLYRGHQQPRPVSIAGNKKKHRAAIVVCHGDGRLADAGFRLQVQQAALRKAMKRHFGGASAPFGDEKIDGFISIVRLMVKEIDPGSVRVSGYFTTDSNIVYGQLGETEVNALIAKCGAQFEGAEVESIRRFVEAHRDTGDVMSVSMRRHMAIEQPAKS
jgi:hypothetical protein